MKPTILRGKTVRAVTIGEAVAIWMADQVPLKDRGSETDPVKIVDQYIAKLEKIRASKTQ